MHPAAADAGTLGLSRPDGASYRTGGPRVLQLSKFFPPVMGGIETVAWEMAEGLHRAGAVADVLCSHHERRTVVERSARGYRIVRASSWGRVLSTSVAPAMVPELSRMAGEYGFIHLHMPDPMAALAYYATRPRGRLVVHWHSDVIRQRVAMHAYRRLQSWVLRRSDAIVTTSDAYARSSDALREFSEKLVVIPIGISDERYRPDPGDVAAIRARRPGKRIVFSLGRMTHYKGFEVLVRAATSLPDDCVVLIGGDGELLGDLKRQIERLGLEHKVEMLGHIRDDQLAAHFAACDIFCMPSTLRSEAYGVAIVEAMAMGKPVVATDIAGSGVPWVNVHLETGLNVPVGNPVALAVALRKLLAEPRLRHYYGSAARARYEREFRAELMVERMSRLYESLSALADGDRGRARPGLLPLPETVPMALATSYAATIPMAAQDDLPELVHRVGVVDDTTGASPSVRRQDPVEEAG
jgi:glycosyltransferase involved in cell wall biosynthesis